MGTVELNILKKADDSYEVWQWIGPCSRDVDLNQFGGVKMMIQ